MSPAGSSSRAHHIEVRSSPHSTRWKASLAVTLSPRGEPNVFSYPFEYLKSPEVRNNPAAKAAVAEVDRIIMEADALLAAAIGRRLLPKRWRDRRRHGSPPPPSFWPHLLTGQRTRKQ